MIKYATIKSPFPGVITERLVDHGSFVKPATSNSGATPLFVVTRTVKVRVVVAVPNMRAFHVQRGQTVVLHKIGGLGSGEIPGQVSRVATNLNRESRMLRIEADFENPVTDPNTGKSHTLLPGMFGTVRITLRNWTAKTGGRLPVVPESAPFMGKDDRRYVVVVGTDGVAHRREVDIILFKDAIRVGPLEGKVGVRAGLKVGETVVTEGAAGLAEGTVISAEKSN
jgi:RND family efflux transporter MFP subunit